MQIPINGFELIIDEEILERGFSYFKKGKISHVDEISPGFYEAIVNGTEDYIVKLKIKNELITEISCNCPYDFGPVCKHVAGVIFFLQKDKLELESQSSPKKGAKKKAVKHKTAGDTVNEALKKIPDEELKNFIKEQSLNDPEFRRIFLTAFSHLTDDESVAFYSQQVKSILMKAKDRYGFIDWSAVRYVGNAVGDILNTAGTHIDKQNYKSAIFICCAVMEEMTKALQFADDSSGDIGGNADMAFNLLHDISLDEDLPDEIRNDLFLYCIKAYNKNIYSGWDWHIGVLDIASNLVKTEGEAKKIFALLNAGKRSEYEESRLQIIKYRLILNVKGEREANKFIEQNISNPYFREEVIKKAISEKDFDKAIKAANEGIKSDNDKPGLVMDWYDWLLKIAAAQNNKTKIIEYARLLFIESIRNKQEYYRIMKSNVEKEKWDGFVEDLILDTTKDSRWYPVDEIAQIYINEKWWDRLFELISKEPSLGIIENYEKHLSNEYANELINLYEQEIIKYLKQNTGRNHYKNACRYLRRIIKLGGSARANYLKEMFKREYPQRRALLDELNRV